jgi:hypothetical protein
MMGSTAAVVSPNRCAFGRPRDPNADRAQGAIPKQVFEPILSVARLTPEKGSLNRCSSAALPALPSTSRDLTLLMICSRSVKCAKGHIE